MGPGARASTTKWLWAALAAGALIRLALIVHAETGGAFALGDGRFYLDLGRSLAAGRGLSISDDLLAIDPRRGEWTVALVERWRSTGLWDFIVPGRPTAFVMPLYPLFVGGVFALFGPHTLAVRLLQLILGLAVPWLLYEIGRRAFNPLTGVVAAWGGALYSFFVFYTASITNQLFSILALLAVAAGYLWCRAKPSYPKVIGFGLVAGAAFLVRAEIVIPALLAAALLGWRLFRSRGIAPAAAAVGLIIGCGLLVTTPWAFRNASSLGRFSYFATQGPRVLWECDVQPFSAEFGRGDVPGYYNLYTRLRAEALPTLKRADLVEMPRFNRESEFERAEILNGRVLTFLRANPGLFARLCLVRAAQLVRFESLNFGSWPYRLAYAAYPVLLFMGIVGLMITAIWGPRSRFLYALCAYALAVLVVVAYGTAFRAASLDLWLVLFAAAGAARVSRGLSGRGRP